jgi:hypothetical protein
LFALLLQLATGGSLVMSNSGAEGLVIHEYSSAARLMTPVSVPITVIQGFESHCHSGSHFDLLGVVGASCFPWIHRLQWSIREWKHIQKRVESHLLLTHSIKKSTKVGDVEFRRAHFDRSAFASDDNQWGIIRSTATWDRVSEQP